MRERLPKTSPDYSSSSDSFLPPCIFETTLRHFLLGLFLFCGRTLFFSFWFVLCWTRLKRVLPWTRAAALARWFVFVAYCLLMEAKPLCCPVEWVSVTIENEPPTNSADFYPIPIFPDVSFCLFRNIVGCLRLLRRLLPMARNITLN